MISEYFPRSDELVHLLDRIEKMKILIVGDIMLDEHIWTDVQRISPEAPVQVAEVQRITRVGGGAANVAANVCGLGATAHMVGVVGQDDYAQHLIRLLKENGTDTSGIVVDKERPTTLKTRIIARGQHVIRIDNEKRTPISQSIEKKLYELALKHLQNADTLIISDYAKGVLTPGLCQSLIKKARELGKPVVVNPKGKDFIKYQGTTIIIPNEKEAEIGASIEIRDDTTLKEAAGLILQITQAQWALITRGSKGISIFSQGYDRHIPAIPVEVYDVAGAGDTVVAVLGTLLPLSAPIETMASVANFAASRVIQKPGVAPITKQELIEHIDMDKQQEWQGKIKTRHELETIVQNLKKKGKKVVFTNGCFDILHAGHVRLLQQACKQGDVLVIGLNSDRSVRQLKGKDRPVNGEKERAEVLAALSAVDYVTIFDEDTPEELLRRLQVNIHVKGGDYALDRLPEAQIVKQYGGQVILLPYESGYSTSGTISKIQNG